MSSSTSICLNSLIPLEIRANSCRSHLGISILKTRETKLSTVSCTRLHNSQITTPTTTSNQQQQLNLSVLRFTLGIPGLDESYLPRWIGYVFGALLLLNHFVGSDSTTATPAQFRSEALGLSLAGFSIVLPYLGKFLKGATPVDQTTVPESAVQIFVMSQNVTDNVREDLAWGTYVLLRNTNTISVLISLQDALCVRGYWNTPEDVSKDPELWEMLPKGTRSLLVQPVPHTPKGNANQDLVMRRTIGSSSAENGLYLLDQTNKLAHHSIQFPTTKEDLWLWHQRLGHSSFHLLRHLFPYVFTNNNVFEFLL
ncbi:protein COFACTOR ASSEMBLY OF COMPLEX C SUBUNIT B CCB2, chloroplastic isoform X3 [Camellia sinensis]|uniref:protein COFACTOR ASSEMBLY OF COMPLEX C SUBUNIT B CCB2, chloroplastic isoform X3 n=1 Tax=Camellia sinensis TaxID=4442 RepID=UPI001035EF44|nr:protein COFACTOR ASSEMBLY OF COMPLEX C SUBUNIT B CCB2, chloroplastic isoform X3 [Camellia sinensis]